MTHAIQLYSPAGRLEVPDVQWETLSYTLAEKTVGALTVTLPLQAALPLDMLAPDAILLLSRQAAPGRAFEVVSPWLVRSWSMAREASGRESMEILAVHPNDVLTRRIVAYAAESSQAAKSGPADNLIKAIARENFVSPTDTTRTMAALTVDADQGLAPSVAKAFAWQDVLSVCQSLAQMSGQAGTYLGFEVVATAVGAYQLRTYVQQRGQDRRASAGRWAALSPGVGIGAYRLSLDYAGAVTAVIAGGQGEEADRDIQTAVDSAAIAASPIGRIEEFRQATNVPFGDTAGLLDEAEGALYARRPRWRFEGSAVNVPGAMYGIDYGWGDRLTVEVAGQSFDVRVDPVAIQDGPGGEQRDILLRSDQGSLS